MSEVENTELNEVEQDATPEVNIDEVLAEVERLRKHNETLLSEKKAKAEQARQAQLERERLEQEQLRKNGDIEKLEQAWQEKVQGYEQKLQELMNQREKDIIQREARNAVSELTADPKKQKLLTAFIEPQAVVRDDQVWYKDSNGQPVLTRLEFVNIMKASGEYDVLIDGTRASGSGATGQAGRATKSPSEMTEAERLELKRSNPEQFKQLFLT